MTWRTFCRQLSRPAKKLTPRNPSPWHDHKSIFDLDQNRWTVEMKSGGWLNGFGRTWPRERERGEGEDAERRGEKDSGVLARLVPHPL